MSNILLFNKPFNTLCQFTGEPGDSTLKDFINLPDFYAAGRLDKDSEGLLVLTNDGKIQDFIAHPRHQKLKTYWVQVEGDVDEAALIQLSRGVQLRDGLTRPAKAVKILPPDNLWPRTPPIRERKQIPTSWIELSLQEGKNRQVRRMTAAVGYPTLRLIRCSVGDWAIGDLQPGQYRLKSFTLPQQATQNKASQRGTNQVKKTWQEKSKSKPLKASRNDSKHSNPST